MAQRYAVHCMDLGHECHENGKVFVAVDYSDAASQWARYEDCNSADYWIVGGCPANVVVTPVDADYKQNGKPKRMIITGESVPCYSARLVVSGA